MNDEILTSRRAVTRRRALAMGGTVTLGGLLAACSSDKSDQAGTAGTTESSATTSAAPASGGTGVVELLDSAPSCVLTPELTEGPYWFDVDSIREDLRESRPGARLDLALRVQDLADCDSGGAAAPVPNAVVEIWHCDAGGVYSGFESGSAGDGGGPGPPTGGGEPTDDGTYLRGAQPTGRDGIARFTTIYPGWYAGRTVHVHLKVHVEKATVLTTQLFFEDSLNDSVFKTSPYDERAGRETFNAGDSIYDETGQMAVTEQEDGYLGVINLGINA